MNAGNWLRSGGKLAGYATAVPFAFSLAYFSTSTVICTAECGCIEVVNPYYPKYASAKLPWKRIIDAPWAHQRRYVVPTPEQAETTAQLVRLLTSDDVEELSIPRTWRGLSGTRLAMSRLADGDQRVPGIYAHTYFHHADGAWLALYAWLRLEAGMPECIAYEEAIRRATGVRRHVDLADLMSDAVA